MTRRELYSVYNLKDKARLLAMTHASLLATAEDLVPITDNMPHSKSVKSRVEELATKILEVDAELDKQSCATSNACPIKKLPLKWATQGATSTSCVGSF